MSTNFIIISGAQKSGTTSLYSYLANYASIDSYPKEQHVYDRLLDPSFYYFSESSYFDVTSSVASLPLVNSARCFKNKLTVSAMRMINRQRHFLSHDPYNFNSLDAYHKFVQSQNLFIDATPSYMTLNYLSWKTILQSCNKYDLSPNIVFIARNPIERTISHLNMLFQRTGISHGDLTLDSIQSRIYHLIQSDQFVRRNSYHSHISILQTLKIPYILIDFAQLSSVKTLSRIFDFLGFNTLSPRSKLVPKKNKSKAICSFNNLSISSQNYLYEFTSNEASRISSLGYSNISNKWL